jgi:hypothetical protein
MSVDVLDILTIWPPFSAETTSPVIPATLLSAIRALLADIGGLGGIDRIVTGSAGSIGFPHIVIGRLRAEPNYNSKRFYEQDYSCVKSRLRRWTRTRRKTSARRPDVG